MGFLSDKVAEFVNIDYQKKLLSYHGSFNMMDFFKELDTNQQGYLTHQDLADYFQEDGDFVDFDYLSLVKYWNGNDDEDRLTFDCLQQGLAPNGSRQGADRNYASTASHHQSRKSPEQLESQERSWRKQLKFVIYLVGKVAKGAQFEHVLNAEEAAALW